LKIADILATIRHLEGQYVDKVKLGSREPKDHLELSYFSGLRNGIVLMQWINENPGREMDLKQVLHMDDLVTN